MVNCFRAKLLVDGSKANGQLMQRWVKGVWQYRKPTVEEANQHVVDMAI